MSLRSILAAAAATCLALPGAASASATAQVSFGQLTYTLTDLAPGDGIAPSITFTDQSGGGFAPPTVRFFYGQGYITPGGASADDHEPVTASIDMRGLSLGGSVSGSEDPTTISMSGYASADESAGLSGDGSTNLWGIPLSFVLSPNTALDVTAVAHLGGSTAPQGLSDTAAAAAWIEIDTVDQNGPVSLKFPAGFSIDGNDAPVDTITRITGSFANTGTDSVYGYFRLFADAEAHVVVAPPVPEPAQAGMLAAGLLLLALRRRRRCCDNG